MFHKEGYPSIVISTILFAALLWISTAITHPILQHVPALVGAFIWILVLQFFRNPKRVASHQSAIIAAPADGKVVQIKKVSEDEFFGDERLLVSIFMSPLNVHVTRYPCDGEVVYSQYHPGKYLVAWHPKSSTLNERTTVIIRHQTGQEVLYRQIAGALARRIVNYAKKGDTARQGSDAGFIKFGSRIDIFLPLNAHIKVTEGQVVKGLITPIAELG
jgi:phosphatidylserine decarboxylase